MARAPASWLRTTSSRCGRTSTTRWPTTPSITYTPWNDNDKPPAAQGTRPTRAQNFPPADIGGTGAVATVGRFTERDMRFRGFANGGPNAARNVGDDFARRFGRRQRQLRRGRGGNDRWTWNARTCVGNSRSPTRRAWRSICRFRGTVRRRRISSPTRRRSATPRPRAYSGIRFSRTSACSLATGPDRHDAAMWPVPAAAGIRQCLHAVLSRCRPAGKTVRV